MYLPASISEHCKQLHISSEKQKYLLTKKVAISPTCIGTFELPKKPVILVIYLQSWEPKQSRLFCRQSTRETLVVVLS